MSKNECKLCGIEGKDKFTIGRDLQIKGKLNIEDPLVCDKCRERINDDNFTINSIALIITALWVLVALIYFLVSMIITLLQLFDVILLIGLILYSIVFIYAFRIIKKSIVVEIKRRKFYKEIMLRGIQNEK